MSGINRRGWLTLASMAAAGAVLPRYLVFDPGITPSPEQSVGLNALLIEADRLFREHVNVRMPGGPAPIGGGMLWYEAAVMLRAQEEMPVRKELIRAPVLCLVDVAKREFWSEAWNPGPPVFERLNEASANVDGAILRLHAAPFLGGVRLSFDVLGR